MINTLNAYSSLEAGRTIARNLPIEATESARKLYSVLLALSFDWIQHKQYRAMPTHVTWHSSLTLISAVAGMDRVTAWRSLSRLKNLGVVDWRSHKCMFRGRASNSGTVFQVRLHPTEGTRAKLAYHDLRHNWHDMNRAARSKVMSYQTVQHIEKIPAIEVKYMVLKQWTFKTYTLSPVISYKLQPSLESLLAIPNTAREDANQAVDLAAQALSKALADSKSLDYWRKLLHALRRHYSATGNDEFHTVYLQVQRVIKADIIEWPGLRSGSALLVSRLKAYRWYSEVMLSP